MGRFAFSLQPALDVALARERTAGDACLRARSVLVAAEEARAEIGVRESELRDVRRALTAAPPGSGRRAGEWQLPEFYRERLLHVAALRDAGAERATAHVRSAQRALEGARNRRLALERLRERSLATFRAREALREAAEFEEANARCPASGERAEDA